MSRFFMRAAMLLAVVSSTLALSGCGLLPLSPEQRYAPINQVKEEIGYPGGAEIIAESYEDGGGVFGASYFIAELSGEEAFDALSKKAQELDVNCNPVLATTVGCSINGIGVGISKDGSRVVVRLVDTSNGTRGTHD